MSEPEEDQSQDTPKSAGARNEKRRRDLIRKGKLIPAKKPGSLRTAAPPLPNNGRSLTAILDDMRDAGNLPPATA